MKIISVDPQEKLRQHLNALFGTYFILPESTTFIHSKRTGRIKSFSFNEQLAGTLRTDGGIALTLSGAEILLKNPKFKINCVIPSQEAIPFVSEGRSLFCKHVEWCGPNVKVGSDVVIIDNNDKILAVGRSRFASYMMKEYNAGVAVRVRQGIKSGTSTEDSYDARRKPRNATYVRQDGARDERNGRNRRGRYTNRN